MAILKVILLVVFLIAALAVTVIVLCQEGKSAGLGSLSGQVGGGDSYWDKNKKYSLEGKLEKWTKISAIVFIVAALGLMLISGAKSKPTTVAPTTNTTTTEDAATEEATPAGDNAASEEAAQADDSAASEEAAPADDAAANQEEAAN